MVGAFREFRCCPSSRRKSLIGNKSEPQFRQPFVLSLTVPLSLSLTSLYIFVPELRRNFPGAPAADRVPRECSGAAFIYDYDYAASSSRCNLFAKFLARYFFLYRAPRFSICTGTWGKVFSVSCLPFLALSLRPSDLDNALLIYLLQSISIA